MQWAWQSVPFQGLLWKRVGNQSRATQCTRGQGRNKGQGILVQITTSSRAMQRTRENELGPDWNTGYTAYRSQATNDFPKRVRNLYQLTSVLEAIYITLARR